MSKLSPFAASRWRGGISYDYATFPNFERVAGAQAGIVSSSASAHTSGVGAQLEYDTPFRGLRVRAALNRGVQEFQQEYSLTDPLAPNRVNGEVRSTFVDLGLAWRLLSDPFEFSLGGGGSWAENESEFDSFYDDFDEPVRRRHTSILPLVTGSAHLRIRANLGAQISLSHLGSFNKQDADDHYRINAGLTYRFGGF